MCCAYATVGLASTGKGKGGAFYRRLRKDTARRPGSTSRSAHPKATILILSSHIVKGCISLNPHSAPEMALECDTRAAVIIYWPQNSLLVNEILAKAPVNQRRESSRENIHFELPLWRSRARSHEISRHTHAPLRGASFCARARYCYCSTGRRRRCRRGQSLSCSQSSANADDDRIGCCFV